MKRFYCETGSRADGDGFAVTLDGRPVRTPRGAALVLPNAALAAAVAQEWAVQGDEIRPAEMRLTGLANAAIDIVTPDPAAFRAQIGAYAETDALAYRGEDAALLAWQNAEWNPLLDWAERRWGVVFALTTGVVHVAQDPATVTALRDAIDRLDPWMLAALSPLTTLGGSLVTALGVVLGEVAADVGWQAVTLEERFQEQRWGVDADAVAARALKQREWDEAARFAALLRG